MNVINTVTYWLERVVLRNEWEKTYGGYLWLHSHLLWSDVVCCRLIGHVLIVEMTKWFTQRCRQGLQMKGKLCSTFVQSAGYTVVIFLAYWCYLVSITQVSTFYSNSVGNGYWLFTLLQRYLLFESICEYGLLRTVCRLKK